MAGFGGAVKLTGESEYRKALNQITQNLREVSSQMKVTSSMYDKNDNSIQALNDKSQVLNKTLTSQKEKLKVLDKEYSNMVTKYQSNVNAHDKLVKSYEDEKTKLENIEKTLGKSSKEYQEQKQKVTEMGNAVNKSSNALEQNEKALSNMRIKLNNTQSDINKTTKEINSLGKETEDAGKKAETASKGGFTVFKGILANLGTQAINSVISGLKSMGSTFVNVGKQAIESYADYEQLVGGVDTLFKDSSDIVQNYANNAYKTAGLSANNYMETVTSFSASLLQSLNNDTAKSAEVADMAITDMADNANKMGTSMESIQNAYQGFAKQNYTMLDNLKLGYGGTKSEMERLLTDAEKISGIKYDISNLSDVYNAIHVIQGELGITGTTAEEASTTIQGSISSMKSAWQNLLTGIADNNADFSQLISNFVDSIIGENGKGGVLYNLLPRIHTTILGIGDLVKNLLQELVPKLLPILVDTIAEIAPNLIDTIHVIIESIINVLPSLLENLLPVLIESTIDLIKNLVDMLPKILPILMDGIVQTFMGIVDILPELLQTLIQAAVFIIQALAEQMPVLIPEIIDAILEMIPILIDNLPLFVKAGYQLLTGILQGLIKSVPKLLEYIPKIITSIMNYFKQLPSLMLDVGINLVKGLWEGIKNVKDWILDKIKGFGKTILNGIKGIFGIHSPSTLFRDEVGKYLAQGIGVGFTDEMRNVTRDMQNAIPKKLDTNSIVDTKLKLNGTNVSDNFNPNTNGNFNVTINNNSKYTSPAENIRLLRQQHQLYNLKYGKV